MVESQITYTPIVTSASVGIKNKPYAHFRFNNHSDFQFRLLISWGSIVIMNKNKKINFETEDCKVQK